MDVKKGRNKETGSDGDVAVKEDGKITKFNTKICISYTEKLTHADVLRRIGEERQLLNLIRNRKKNWIGHILRGDGIVKEVIEGRMEGKRSIGRPRAGMLDDLVVVSYGDTKRRAEDRGRWKSYLI